MSSIARMAIEISEADSLGLARDLLQRLSDNGGSWHAGGWLLYGSRPPRM